MQTIDVTPAFRDVSGMNPAVGILARQAVGLACPAEEILSWSVTRILDRDQAGVSPFRLLALVVAGGCGLRLEQAIPVAAISRVWWAGVETLDDITDGEFDAARMGMPAAQAMVASTACLSLIPQKAAQFYATARLAAAWARELTDSSLRCADGQLRDLVPANGTVSWQQAMRAYAGKTGAPYGRDAAMAALTAGLPDDQVRGWRSFGALFGVLRQLANDRRGDGRADDADLANGTPTLLLGHAFAQLTEPGQDRLTRLRQAAALDPAQRQRLYAQLTGADLALGYNRRVDAISGCLATLLDRLTAVSRYRHLLHWMITASADQAKVAPAEPPAAGKEVPA